MTEGTVVTLVDVDDDLIERVVVAVEKGVIFVCKEHEYRAAIAENRQPVSIGFRTEYLVKAGGRILA